MLLGIAATAVCTFLSAKAAFSMFERNAYLADSFIERFLRVETVTSTLLYHRPQALVFYTKSERRTWEDFEQLVFRLAKSFSEAHSLNLKVSRDALEHDVRYILGDALYEPYAQGGVLANMVDNLTTCMVKYASRDHSWMSDAGTTNVQMWLSEQLSLEDNQVILNVVSLLASVRDRQPR